MSATLHTSRKSALFFGAAILFLWIAALCFRAPASSTRPMHLDEAVHAEKLGLLLQSGTFVYDPDEYHGPTLYYLTLPVLRFFGAKTLADANETTLRLVPVLFGAGLVLLLWPLRDGIGKSAALWAALFTAISPAMVFYSRYYIQEMLLVFFVFAFLVCAWRYFRDGKKSWCLLSGVALGLMHATKETWILSVFALGCAAPLALFWTRKIDGKTFDWRSRVSPRVLALSLLLAAVISSTLLSNFWRNPRAPLDSLSTYGSYFARAATRGEGDSEHRHSLSYYLDLVVWNRYGPGLSPLAKMRERPDFSLIDGARFAWRASMPPLLWSELAILFLAIVGSVAALRRQKSQNESREYSLARFLVFYTVILAAIYSAIPYKTPWCLLGFWHGAILLAGLGATALLRFPKRAFGKAAMFLFLLLPTLHLAASTRAAIFSYEDDRRNPYVYAQTLRDMPRLGERIKELSALHPDGDKTLICVVAPDAWPLPWYLRRFPNVGYWNDAASVPPEAFRAPIVIAALPLQEKIGKRLGAHYRQETFGQRPQTFLVMNTRADLWRKFLRQRAAASPKTP